MKDKEKLSKELNNVRKEKMERNNQYSQKSYEDRLNEHEDNIVAYDRLRKIKWYDSFYIIGIFGVFLLISTLTSFIKDKMWFEKFTAGVMLGLTLISLLVIIIIGAARNRQAVKMYNDKRRRYTPTFTNFEAIIKRIQKIIILSDIINIISMIIIYFVCKN